ncbi:MAG TPA: rhodanese-like domain-containing protein [Pyrinomonadaceae bacterium]|jgi:rhodanese-related sulfurtransferase
MKTILIHILLLATLSFAGCQNSVTGHGSVKQASVEQTKRAVDNNKNVQFIDVRTESEYESGHAPGTVNLPIDSLEKELAKLDPEKPVYLICQTGRRSQKGAEILEKNNFKNVYNVEGGTSAWEKAGFQVEK